MEVGLGDQWSIHWSEEEPREPRPVAEEPEGVWKQVSCLVMGCSTVTAFTSRSSVTSRLLFAGNSFTSITVIKFSAEHH